jgi:mono/diheme cytochrome c family protein
MQMVLSSAKLDPEVTFGISNKFLVKYGHLPVARDVVLSSLQDNEMAMLEYFMLKAEWKEYSQIHEIFIEMLSTAISNKGEPEEIDQLFKLINQNDSKNGEWLQLAIINGLTNSRGNNKAGEIVLEQKPVLKIDADISSVLLKKLRWPGKSIEAIEENVVEPDIDNLIFAQGRQKYLNLCANCHGTQGEGIKRFAPPLKQSEWVTGEDYKLVMILLYGMEGPVQVNRKRYDIPDILPSMPSFSTLQNEDIAAIATYIRNSWGNLESQVESGTVGHIRFRTQGKIQPWNSVELDTLVFNLKL